MVFQQKLWEHDGYSILMATFSEDMGKRRLLRYLNWLDAVGGDWKNPDLEAYKAYLSESLAPTSVNSEIAKLRRHYVVALSQEDALDHIVPDEREAFVNNILKNLGYTLRNVNYHDLMPQKVSENAEVILANTRSNRLKRFVRWLDKTGRHWTQPDLIVYREVLKEKMTSKQAKVAISAIRARYQVLVDDEGLMNQIEPEQREAFADNLRKHLGYIDEFDVKHRVENDPDLNPFYLRPEQVEGLIRQFDTTTLVGLRDRAIIGLGLYMGLRQFEIHSLQVEDLRYIRKEDGQKALYVRKSKGQKSRIIAYRRETPLREWLREWLRAAKITEGYVARGLYTNSERLRPGRLSTGALRVLLGKYLVDVDGRQMQLIFPDLRCTCGREMNAAGYSIDRIRRDLGFKTMDAALRFLGFRLLKQLS